MTNTCSNLYNCLYFSANALARAITRMAEDAFAPIGLSPTHAFVLKLSIENPGVSPSTLANNLRLAPSTITRLVDALVRKRYLTKEVQGKTTRIHPTETGKALAEPIAAAWGVLHQRYVELLGRQEGDALAKAVGQASQILDQE
jgi:DNA-binding MarR family transcriptional regulator